MKRSPNKSEKYIIDKLISCGCVICGRDAEFHHLPQARPNALAIGYPLCYEHHRGMEYPGQSIHSNRLLFTQKYGSELELLQKAIINSFSK